MIVSSSSLPLPQRIHSGGKPKSSPARVRKAVAIGSGYLAKPPRSVASIARATAAEAP